MKQVVTTLLILTTVVCTVFNVKAEKETKTYWITGASHIGIFRKGGLIYANANDQIGYEGLYIITDGDVELDEDEDDNEEYIANEPTKEDEDYDESHFINNN